VTTRPPTDPEALVAALADAARRADAAAPEPEPEELLDYLAGRLAPEAEERVRRHLVASPDAARALLELAELEGAKERAATADRTAPADLVARAGWRDLQTRLRPAAGSRRGWLTPSLAAAAAALLVTTVGLGLRLRDLQRTRDLPVANLTDLELGAATRAGAEPTATLPPGAPLRLVLQPFAVCDDYEAVLSGPAPGEGETVRGLRRDPLGLVTVLLRPEPGSYALQLRGCEPRRLLEEHDFVVAREPPPTEPRSPDR
jgi:hypothetical protein